MSGAARSNAKPRARGLRGARLGGAAFAAMAAAISLVTACTLTTSFDGLSGGAAVSSPDAQPGPDAPSDAVIPPDPRDAADVAPRDAAAGFCASSPPGLHLCADFDDGTVPPPLKVLRNSVGDVTVVSGDVRSPPFAALFTTQASSTAPSASLFHALPSGQSRVTIEMDLKVDELGAASAFDVVTIRPGDSAAEIGFQINRDGTLSFDEDFADPASPTVETKVGISMPTSWTHVKLALQLQGTTVAAQLALDGVEVGTHTFQSRAITSPSTDLEIGDASQGALSKSWRVRMDNITIDLR